MLESYVIVFLVGVILGMAMMAGRQQPPRYD